MPKIQVLLSAVAGVIKGGDGARRTVALNLDLNLMGAGDTLATSSPQAAELLFFEGPMGKDVAREPQQFAKLEGTLRLVNGQPEFDVNRKLMTFAPEVRSEVLFDGVTPNPPLTSTDYRIRLEYGPAFKRAEDVNHINNRLFLPWRDVAAEEGTIDLGCELTIGGQVEFKFDAGHFLQVPMKHLNVLVDGVDVGRDDKLRTEFHGIGVVHPTRNWLLSEFKVPPRKITFPAPPSIQVLLHDSVDTLIRDGARVEKAIRDCFSGTGITVDIRRGQTSAQAKAFGLEFRRDPLHAGDVLLMASDEKGGATIPFFTWWVSFSADVTKATPPDRPLIASGLQEEVLKVTANGASSTKAVRYPITLLRGLKKDFGNLTGADQTDLHLGNIIAHEVGHGFGFDHSLEADPVRGYCQQLGDPDFVRCVMCWENLGANRFTRSLRFGPVFTSMLKRDFALP